MGTQRFTKNAENAVCATPDLMGEDLPSPSLICVSRVWGPWQGVPYFSTLQVATLPEEEVVVLYNLTNIQLIPLWSKCVFTGDSVKSKPQGRYYFSVDN